MHNFYFRNWDASMLQINGNAQINSIEILLLLEGKMHLSPCSFAFLCYSFVNLNKYAYFNFLTLHRLFIVSGAKCHFFQNTERNRYLS